MYDIHQVSKIELINICREISKSIYTFKLERYAEEHLPPILKEFEIWDEDYDWVKDVSTIKFGGYCLKGLAFKVDTSRPSLRDLSNRVSESPYGAVLWTRISSVLTEITNLETEYKTKIFSYLQTSVSSRNKANCSLFWFEYIQREFEKECVIPAPLLTHEELLATNQYYRENQHIKDEIRLLLMEKELCQ